MNNHYIAHHGIKGQKWGVRRFQNEDGSYTDTGKKRRSTSTGYEASNSKTKRKGFDAVRDKNYSKDDARSDLKNYGYGAAKRINRRIKQGSSLEDARAKEDISYEATKKFAKKVNTAVSVGVGYEGAKMGYHAARHVADALMSKAGYYNDFVSRGAGAVIAIGAGYVSGKLASKIGDGKLAEMGTRVVAGYNASDRKR